MDSKVPPKNDEPSAEELAQILKAKNKPLGSAGELVQGSEPAPIAWEANPLPQAEGQEESSDDQLAQAPAPAPAPATSPDSPPQAQEPRSLSSPPATAPTEGAAADTGAPPTAPALNDEWLGRPETGLTERHAPTLPRSAPGTLDASPQAPVQPTQAALTQLQVPDLGAPGQVSATVIPAVALATALSVDALKTGGERRGTVTEDGLSQAQGTLSVTGGAPGGKQWALAATAGRFGELRLDPYGHWHYQLDGAKPNVQALREGQVVVEHFTTFARDGLTGQTQAIRLSITVKGSNDAALISGVSHGSVTEDLQPQCSGKLTITDVDQGEAQMRAGDLSGQYGTLHLAADGQWTYELSPSTSKILAAGTALSENLTVHALDGTAHLITVAIAGSNDAPLMALLPPIAAEEGGPVVTGQLSASDADPGDTLSFSLASPVAGFQLNADGSYRFDPTDPAYEHLQAGEALTLNIPVTVTDSQGAQDNQRLQITLSGTNDAPTLLLTPLTTQEDAAVLQGQIIGADKDSGDTLSYSSATTTPGFTIQADGSYRFDPADAAYQHLGAGQTQDVLIPITVTDSAGASHTENLLITVSGSNDAPGIASPHANAHLMHEDGATTSLSGQLRSHDADSSDTLSWQLVGTGQGTFGQLSFDPHTHAWTYQLDNAKAQTDALHSGQRAEDVFQITATDSAGATASTTIRIAISGANDAPVLSAQSQSVIEDGALLQGQLIARDVDAGDRLSFSLAQAVDGFTLNADGSYRFDPAHASYQHLGAGQTQLLRIPVTVTDIAGASHTQDLSITLTGSNDAARIAGTDAVTVNESSASATGQLLTGGQLSIDDIDAGEAHFKPLTDAPGRYGVFSIDPAGHWRYQADATQPAIQQLKAGESVVDSLVISAADGTQHTLSVQIQGQDSGATISGADTASVTEDQALTSTQQLHTGGQLSVVDPDAGQAHFLAQADVVAIFGHFSLDATGAWTYQADNSQAAIQRLKAGETLTDTLSVQSADGTAHTVTVTIQGTNDTPVLAAQSQAVSEDGALLQGRMVASDVDAGDTQVFSTAQPVDGFTLNANGSYSFDPAHAAYQHLAAGQTQDVLIPVTVTDSAGASSTQSLTITITGANDGAVIGGRLSNTLMEDSIVSTGGMLRAGGRLTVLDPDAGEAVFVAQTGVSGAGHYGSFSIDANGRYSYTADNTQAAIQQLKASDSLTDGFTVTTADGTQQVVTITIKGAEDRPVLQAQSHAVTEDGTRLTGQMLATDVDAGDTQRFAIAQPVAGFVIHADGSFSFDPANAAYQHLAAGQTQDVVIPVTVTDSAGATSTQNLTITVTGLNDGAVIGGVSTGNVTEDQSVQSGHLQTSGQLTVVDVDAGEAHFIAQTGVAGSSGLGHFSLDASGAWTYSADNAQAAIQHIKTGETLTDSLAVSSADGATHTVTVTIHGTNDAPVLAAQTQTVTEDGALLQGHMVATDGDAGDTQAFSSAQAVDGFTLNSDGSYSFDPSHASYQQLAAGQTQTLLIPITVTDSAGATHTQNLSITVTGLNDGAVISGVAVGTVTEDQSVQTGQLRASGQLSVTDLDAGESHFVAQTGVASAHGHFSVDATGQWTYTADNTQTAIQELKAGESLTDTLTVASADGATHTLTVTIQGTNDVPLLQAQTQSVSEDGALLQGRLVATDVDAGDTQVLSTAQTVDGFTLNADGSYSFDPAHAAYQHLAAGQTQDLVIPVTVTDSAGASSTRNLTLTITGTNDGATIAGVSTGSTREDSQQAVTGQLTIADVDDGQAHFVAQSSTAGSYGSFTLAKDGQWSYQLDNSKPEVQALKNGETLTDTLTVHSADGTSHTISLTINGRDDGAVIGGTDTGAVREDQAAILTASGSLSISDPDASEGHFTAQTNTAGLYGHFSVDATGHWNYSADNNQAAVQELKAGDSLIDSMTVASADGTTHTVLVTIQGTNDAPVLTAQSRAVTEDGAALTGQMRATDLDHGDTQAFSLTQAVDGFTLNADGSYRFDPAHASYQHLAAGQTQDVVIPVTVMDSAGATSTQNLTITITGSNDGAIIGGRLANNVTEDAVVSTGDQLRAGGQLTVADPDAGEDHFVAQTGVSGAGHYGSFSIDTSGRYSYTADNTQAAIQQLKAGDTLSDSFSVATADGTQQVVTITIHGTEDRPLLQAQTHAVTEDGAALTGQMLATDVDAGDTQVFSIAQPVDGFTLAADGSYSFDPSHASYQHLAAGQMLDVVIAVTVKDSAGASSTQNLTITVTGVDDGAIIGGVNTGTVTEDQSVQSGHLQASGQLTITDTDSGEDHFLAQTDVAGSNSLGHFSLDASGAWTYRADNTLAAIQQLKAGDSLSDSLTVHSADGTAHTVTVTIHGTNDTPVLAAQSQALREDGALLQGHMVASDVDAQDSHSFSIAQAVDGFTLNADGSYSFDPAHASYQHLAAGQTQDIVIPVTVTDSAGATATQDITITLTGTNDAPRISGTDAGRVVEDQTLSASGQLQISDVDDGQAHFVAQTATAGSYGSLTLSADGQWQYQLDNAKAEVQALKSTETATDTFTVHSADGSSHSITVTIQGQRDHVVIGGVDVGVVKEDVSARTGGLLVATGESAEFVPITQQRTSLGEFSMDAAGAWVYTLDNSRSATEALKNGETATDTVSITHTDGTRHTITITVMGSNDAPVLSAKTQAVTEDGSLLSGRLAATDVDAGDTQTFSTAQSVDGFTLNADGSYSFDPAHASYQHLAAGQTQDVLIPVTVTDSAGASSTQNLTITVTGLDDGAIIGGVSTGAVTEDQSVQSGQLHASGQLTVTDADTGEDHFVAQTSVAASYGSFSIDAAGHWTYAADNSQAAVQQLKAGATLSDSFTVSSADGSTHTVTVTLTGSNDAPVLQAQSQSVVEDGTRLRGLMVASDVDAGDSLAFSMGTAVAGFTLNADGSYSFDPSDTAYQQLAAGQVQTLSIPITVTDTAGASSTQNLLISITGTGDAAVIGGRIANNVTEDAVVSTGGLLRAAGQLTVVDPDAGEAHFVAQTGVTGAGHYGSFSIDASGHYSYTADNTQTAIQQLKAGQTLSDSFTVATADGTQQVVTITINGAEDKPVLQAQTHAVTEDGARLSGQMLATDADAGDTLRFSIAQQVAGFAIQPDGSFSFDPANAAYQHLAAGQTQDLVIPVTVSDSAGATSTQNLTITVTGANDGPTVAAGVAAPADLGSTAEDTGRTFTQAELLKLVGASDVDTNDHLSISGVSVDASYGAFTKLANGDWRFAPAANAHHSDIPLTLSVSDGHASTSAHATFDLTPVTDAATPVLAVMAEQHVIQFGNNGAPAIYTTGGIRSGGNLNNFAMELTVVGGAQVAVQGHNGPTLISYATANNTNEMYIWRPENVQIHIGGHDYDTGIDISHDSGSHRYGFVWDSATGSFDLLRDGQVLKHLDNVAKGSTLAGGGVMAFGNDQDSLGGGFQASDAWHGQLFSASMAKGVTAAQMTQHALRDLAQGDALIMDVQAQGPHVVDLTGHHTFASTGPVTTPTTQVDTRIANPNPGAVLHLSPQLGAPLDPDDQITLAVLKGFVAGTEISDGHGHTHIVTGTSDAVDITAWDQSSLTAQLPAGSHLGAQLVLEVTTTGPGGQSNTASSLVQGVTLNDGGGDVTAVAEVSISIAPMDSPALIGGVDQASVSEDSGVSSQGELQAHGALTIQDPDPGQAAFHPQTSVATQYGHFSIDAQGAWVYSAANANAAIQALKRGETLSDLLQVSSLDGAQHTIEVSIQGTNDAPVLAAQTQTVTEDGTQLTGQMLVTDADAGDTQTFSMANAVDGFTLNADGSYNFDPSHASYQHLAAGQTQDVVIPVTVTDSTGLSSTQNLTITVTGSNDGPLVTHGTAATAADLGAINEDAPHVFSEADLLRLVGASDVDDGAQLHIVAGSLTSAHGTFTGDAAHGFTFTPAANFSGQDVNLQFSVSDGTASREAQGQLDITPVADAPDRLAGKPLSSNFDDAAGAAGWQPKAGSALDLQGGSPVGGQAVVLTKGDFDALHQDIDTFAGQHVHLSFDVMSARHASVSLQVLWEGKVVGEIFPKFADWESTHTELDLVATGPNSRLEFRAGGDRYNNGQVVRLDNVNLRFDDIRSDRVTVSNQDLRLSLDSEFRLTDSDGSESLHYLIKGLPFGFTLTDGTHSVTVGQADQEIDTRGWQQDALRVQAPHDYTGAVDIQVTARSEEAGNQQTADAPLLPMRLNFESADVLTVAEDTPKTFSTDKLLALAGLVAPHGQHLSLSDVQVDAALGHFSHNSDGSWTFTPAANVSADQVPITLTATGGAQPLTASLSLAITPVVDAPIGGLSVNTDFDHQAVGSDGWAFVDGTGLGWHTDYAKGIQVGQDKLYGGSSSTNQIVELNANGGSNIYRDLPTTAGQALRFGFDLSARGGNTVAALEVVWEGKVIDTIKPGSAFGLVHHDYDLVATGANSRIELRATGGGDGRAIIDNIAINPPPVVGLVNHAVHLDVGQAFQLADTDGSETISYLINGLPVGFTLSDGSHSVTATTAGQQLDLKGWRLDSLVLQPPADFEGQLVLKVSARAEEGATHESATSSELPLQLSFERLSTAEDTPRSFSERELLQLAGVVPALGQRLSLSDVQVDPAFGQVTHNADGSWTFTPAANVSADQVALNLTVAGSAQSQQVALPLQITAVTDAPLLGAGVISSDFEQLRATDSSGSQFFDPGKYGWHSDGAGGVEVGPETSFGGSRSGNQVLELISKGASGAKVPNLYRELTTEPGQHLQFAFDLSRRAGWAVGPVEVLWEGKVIDTITSTDSGFALHRHTYDLVATGSSARLELRVLGDTVDQRAVLDKLYIGPPPQLAMVNHELHLKLDGYFHLADTDGSESLSYLIKGLPLGFTLSDGSHSVTVTAADQVIDTQGWQQDALSVQAPQDFSGTLDLSISGRSEEGSTHQTATSAELPLRLSFESLATTEDTQLTFSESKLLALSGVVPGAGEHLSLSDVQVDAAFGQITHNADGSWTFTPAANVSADQVALQLTVAGGAQPITASLPLSITPVVDAPVLAWQPVQPDIASQHVGSEGWAYFDPSQVGWHTDNHQGVYIGTAKRYGGADDHRILELAGIADSPMNFYRTLDTQAGQTLRFSFDMTGRPGRPPAIIEVLFEGKVIDTLSPDNQSYAMQRHAYELTATGPNARIELRAQAQDGQHRTLIDHIEVINQPQLEALVNHDLQLGLDRYVALTDTDGSETISYQIQGLPVGFTLSDGGHSVTVTAADQVIETKGWQQDALHVQAPKDFAGTLDLSVTGRSEEGANHQSASSAVQSLRLSFEQLSTAEDTPLTLSESKLLALAGVVPAAGEHLSLSDVQVDPALGHFTHDAGGSWTFTPAANVNADQVPFTLTVTGGSQPVSASLQLSITPVNDAPVLSAATAAATEDGAPLTGQLVATDPDAGDTQTFSLANAVDGFTLNADGSYSFDPSHASYQHLAAGQTQDLVIPVTVTDSAGATSTQNLTLTVTGSHDGPLVTHATAATAADLGAINEDTPRVFTEAELLQAVGASAVDDGAQLHIVAGSLSSAHGSFSGDAAHGFTFTPAANFSGQDVELQFSVTDGSVSREAHAQLTITPVADAPVRDGGPTINTDFNSVDVGAPGWKLSDPTPLGWHSSEASGVEIGQERLYGGSGNNQILSLTASWSSNIYRDLPTQAGQTVHVGFDLSARPGFAMTPVEVLWEGKVIDTISPTAGIFAMQHHGYDLVATGGNSRLEFRATGQGEARALFDNIQIGTPDHLTLGDHDTLLKPYLGYQLADTDGSETLSYAIHGLPVGFTLTDGTHSVTVATAGQVIETSGWNQDALALRAPKDFHGDASIQVSARAEEGSNHQVASATDLTLHLSGVPIKHVAVIGGDTAVTVTEDQQVNAQGNLEHFGLLTVNDPDAGEATFVPQNAIGTQYGRYTIGQDGHWLYTADNKLSAIQQLKTGEHLTDSFTVHSADGTAQTITVTIQGQDDAPAFVPHAGPTRSDDVYAQIANALGSQAHANFKYLASMMLQGADTYPFERALVVIKNAGVSLISPDGSVAKAFAPHGGTLTEVPISEMIAWHAKGAGYQVVFTDAKASEIGVYAHNNGNPGMLSGRYPYTDFVLHPEQQVATLYPVMHDVAAASGGAAVQGALAMPPAIAPLLFDGGHVQEDSGLLVTGFIEVKDADAQQSAMQPQTGTATHYGRFSIDVNGDWIYQVDNSRPEVQQLGDGQTLVDTITVHSEDGTAHEVNVTIHGQNDGAVIAGADSGTVVEDHHVTAAGTIVAKGQLTVTDADAGQAAFVAQSDIATQYGHFSLAADGHWTYTVDNSSAQVQALKPGGTPGETADVSQLLAQALGQSNEAGFKAVAEALTQQQPGAAAGVLDLSIEGAAIVLSGPAGTAPVVYAMDANGRAHIGVDELLSWLHQGKGYELHLQGNQSDVQVFVHDRGDAGDLHPLPLSAAADLSDPASAAQHLALSWHTPPLPAELSETVTVRSVDGTEHTISLSIFGTAENAVIAGVDTGSVTEDAHVTGAGMIEAHGKLTVQDPNAGQAAFSSLHQVAGQYGHLSLYASGLWTYTADNNSAALNALNKGQTAVETFVVKSVDGTAHSINITVNGADEKPDLWPEISRNLLAQSGGDTRGYHVIAERVAAGDSNGLRDVVMNVYDGKPTVVDAAGHVLHTFDHYSKFFGYYVPMNELADQLKAHPGAMLVLQGSVGGNANYYFHNADDEMLLNFNGAYRYQPDKHPIGGLPINGIPHPNAGAATHSNTAAQLGGADSGSVLADGDALLQTQGHLTVLDADGGQAHFAAQRDAQGHYGKFSIDAQGSWHYQADGHAPALSQLAAGQKLSETFTVHSADGTAHTITVQLFGDNASAAVITGADTASLSEDLAVQAGQLQASGQLNITDSNVGQDHFLAQSDVAGSAGLGHFSLDASGAWTYSVDNSKPEVQQLKAGETVTDTLTVSSADGTTHQITVTLSGSNDAAVITGADSGAVREDGSLSASGKLTVSDADSGQASFSAQNQATAHGSFTLTTSGDWTYTLDNHSAAVQALKTGESLSDSITVRSVDGSSHVVTVLINGANDAPVLQAQSQSVTEDGSVLHGQLLASDADHGEHLQFSTSVQVSGFSLNADGSYAFDPGHADYQSLGAGQQRDISIPVLVSDGSGAHAAQFLTLHISGRDDGAVIMGVDTGHVHVGGQAQADGQLQISDADAGQAGFQAGQLGGSFGSLSIDAQGHWQYQLNSSDSLVQQLLPHSSLTDQLSVHSLDGTAHNIDVQISGPVAVQQPPIYQPPVQQPVAAQGHDAYANILAAVRAGGYQYQAIADALEHGDRAPMANVELAISGSHVQIVDAAGHVVQSYGPVTSDWAATVPMADLMLWHAQGHSIIVNNDSGMSSTHVWLHDAGDMHNLHVNVGGIGFNGWVGEYSLGELAIPTPLPPAPPVAAAPPIAELSDAPDAQDFDLASSVLLGEAPAHSLTDGHSGGTHPGLPDTAAHPPILAEPATAALPPSPSALDDYLHFAAPIHETGVDAGHGAGSNDAQHLAGSPVHDYLLAAGLDLGALSHEPAHLPPTEQLIEAFHHADDSHASPDTVHDEGLHEALLVDLPEPTHQEDPQHHGI